jgi:hypothetical protein
VTEVSELLDSYPVGPVENSQPPGIGRVVALGDTAAWNNLGRNIVFSDRHLRPRAYFSETLFPDHDEPSQYDLDVHAIAALPRTDLVIALNHLGTVRAFRASEIAGAGPPARVHPLWTRQFAEDIERAVVAGNRLIGSGSRAAAAKGLVVSEPLDRSVRDGPLSIRAELGTWGEVTALAAITHRGEPAVAVGGPGRVSLVPLIDGNFGRAHWDVDVPFRAASFSSGPGVLWVAGSALVGGIDDYEWEKVHGGGVVALDPADGRVIAAASLPDDVAWGNGGVAFVVLDGLPCVVARSGALCVAPRDLGASRGGSGGGWRLSSPLSDSSLGIAHAAVVANRLLYGFNRGGYQLYAVAHSAAERLLDSK